MSEEESCERCFYKRAVDTWEYEDRYGQTKELEVCSQCRHDLINGGQTFLGHGEAYSEQLERHRSDPLWEPHPDSIAGEKSG